jgi:plastocyanin
MRHVFHTFLLMCAAAASAAPFEMQFIGVDGKPLGGVVVTLRSTDASRPPARPPAKPEVMDQINQQFDPHVLVIPAGTRVSFPNSDTVAHQVYSFSDAKKFDLPLYTGKPPNPVLFDQPGIVTVGCNIHDQMRGYVYVVEAQYLGRADHDGRWSVPNAEPGDYQLTIWHPLSRKQQKPVLEQRVTINSDGTKLALRASGKLSLRGESQVPSNWDAY